MRSTLLIIMLGYATLTNYALAADAKDHVSQLEQQLATKDVEYQSFMDSFHQLTGDLSRTNKSLEQTRAKRKSLEVRRKQALIKMNQQYELMVDNPEQDITPSQNNYRQSIANLKTNKDDIQRLFTDSERQKAELAQAKIKQFTLANERESIAEDIKVGRVLRLQTEFEQQANIEVERTVQCSVQETLQRCITRSNLLAKQKASKDFIKQLFSNASESALISRHKQDSSARIKIMDHKVLAGQFSGQGNYTTKVAIDVQGSLPLNQACVLLNLSNRYCIDSPQNNINVLSAISQENIRTNNKNVMYEVTIRSDQYDDEVFIDGVSYGSTKLITMLNAGSHDVVISKQGYEDYSARIYLDRNRTLKAELNKAKIIFSAGQKVQDILAKNTYGPELVGIPAGNFQMGELKGGGIGNEAPAKGVEILNAFAIGQSQITVGDFKRFVDATQYVTEAEISKGCAALQSNGQPQYAQKLNWRTPGFKQSNNHPVVCVSKKDSKAYLSWLSRVTERQYRLPKESEWEYVARAGSSEDYPWGSDIGTAKANCAYCGSEWSNIGTAPVKSFTANAFGLFDTVGNVWELTASTDPVARGGAWNFAPKLSKSSMRLELPSEFRANYVGFRVLRED